MRLRVDLLDEERLDEDAEECTVEKDIAFDARVMYILIGQLVAARHDQR